MLFQWITGVGVGTKPTKTYPRSCMVFAIIPHFFSGCEGSEQLHITSYSTTQVTLVKGMSGTAVGNIPKGYNYTCLIWGT